MIKPSNLFLFVFISFCFWANSLCAQKLDFQEIERLILNLKQNLLKNQNQDGSWFYKDESHTHYHEGMTSLVTLALLHSETPPSNPQIQKAIHFLLNSKNDYTYCLSLKIAVFAKVDPKKYLPEIQKFTKSLIRTQAHDGGFSYYNTGGSSDGSNTQFAALGLYTAERCGIAISPQVWHKMIKFLKFLHSSESGGFGYKSSVAMPSMTAGSLAALHMAQTMTYKETQCGEWHGGEIEKKSLYWLAKYFKGQVDLPQNSKGQIKHYELYFLYALERMAHLMGIRELEDWDWFYQGIQIILKRNREQKLDQLYDQAFALLFLTKGRTPVVVGKIQLATLNETHPHDIENLVFEASKKLKQPLAYQKVRLTGDLSDIPMLFLNGHDAFKLNKKQIKCLQQYLESGGLLVGEACCNKKKFATSFRRLTYKLLKGKSKLQPLAKSHPIYQVDSQTIPAQEQTIYGAGYRCKTSILFCSKHISGHFQKKKTKALEFKIGLNLLRFALSEGKLLDRLSEKSEQTQQNSKIELAGGPPLIAKLAHQGDWNNDADDLAGLLQIFQQKTGKSGNYITIKATETEFPQVPIIYLNGHQAPKLSSAQKKALRNYIEDGGIVFGEACCDKTEFAKGFSTLMRELFPLVPLQKVNKKHFLYRGGKGTPPPIYAMRLGCRQSVFLSPKDLSCHWDPKCPWCKNKLEDWAERIGINLLENTFSEEDAYPLSELPEIKEKPLHDAIHFGQIIHQGDFNPDTIMMERLIRNFHHHFGLHLSSKPRFIQLDQENLYQFPFLYLTGHHLGSFKEAELAALRKYLKRGGTLVAEACCGSKRFKEQFFQLSQQLFPEKHLSQLSLTHPLLQKLTLKTRNKIPVELPLILEEKSHLLIFFSPLDLGCSIQGHQCPQCRGFDSKTSFKLYQNLFNHLMSH